MGVEVLRRAAKVLREHAEAATPGPWNEPFEIANCPGDNGWWIQAGVGMQEYAVTVTLPYNPRAEADSKHIALMHPPVALALADLLDLKADCANSWPGDMTVTDRAALAVARAILREPEATS